MFKVSRKPPHRVGFVLPGVQRPDVPGRRPLSTRRAQSRPRLACPLYVWKIMQVNDWGLGAAPRASTGRARGFGSFLRSFTFRQIFSLFNDNIERASVGGSFYIQISRSFWAAITTLLFSFTKHVTKG